ncbi:MAG: hypothetical protein GX220_04970 [Treponema sp.]|nr:hypothetical protein [Treponema sp.]
MKKNFTIIFFIFFVLSISNIYSQLYNSHQGHSGNITSIVQSEENFFTSGSDGFIIKWDKNGTGEHYQLSSIEIKMLVTHPTKDEIAIYETDGFSVYRLSVWKWQEKKLIFSNRFTDSITSLNYSAQGTFLIVGTSSVDGLFFLDSTTGKPIPILKEQIGVTTLTKTNKSESTAVLYSPSGFIYYADIKTGEPKANIECSSYLENPLIFSNNIYLAGSSYNGIEIINAIEGNTVATININSNIFFVTNENDKDLLFIDYNNLTSTYELKVVFMAKPELKFKPIIINKFKLENDENITYATKYNKNIIIGSDNGNLFKLNTVASNDVTILNSNTKKTYNKIIDIAEHNGTFLLLTEKNIFAANYKEGTSTEIAINNNKSNRINSCGNKIILWTYNDKNPIYLLNEDGSFSELYFPSKSLHNVRCIDTHLLIIEGNSIISLVDLNRKTSDILYNGTGLQDALIISIDDKQKLIIAKTASSNPKSSLLTMDLETKETVSLQIKSDVVFSLCENSQNIFSNTKSKFYGISSTTDRSIKKTEIFLYDLQTKTYSPISYWADEDTNAFIKIFKDNIFTNIGKTNIRSIKLSSREEFIFPRTFALAEKLVANNYTTLVLNKDGSLCWFNENNNYLSSWFLGLDETFVEY